MDIKSLVKGDKTVSFIRYTDGILHYATDCGFSFPVPITDVGDATFLASDRAMLFMRYLRKQLADNTQSFVASVANEVSDSDPVAVFLFYKGGDLWFVTKDGFEFPVPVAGLDDSIGAVAYSAQVDTFISAHREYLASALRETTET